MQVLTPEEREIERTSLRWVIDHKTEISQKFADEERFIPDPEPVSIFMAGTPGAGKTEYSRTLNNKFIIKAVRIDADEIREMIPRYNGENSYVFQRACTAAVNNLFGHALKRKQNLILDGTFAYEHSLQNIERSLTKRRKVVIYFIYQNPEKAWDITKAREEKERRRVFKENFIESYFKSRVNIKKVKSDYEKDVQVNLVIKEYEKTGLEKVVLNINDIDGYLGKVYTRNELERLIQ